jgi:hypothetical protein
MSITREELQRKSRSALATFVCKADLAKDDLGTGDLAAGGAKAPQQGNPTPFAQHPTKPRGLVAKTVDFQGLPVHVDRPYGHVQNGMDDRGNAWKRIYHVDYGFVPNTQGGDQEGLDVYLGLDHEAKDAHWILQKKADGTFDEYKVMLGFGCADFAKGMYLAHTPKKHFGGVASTSVQMMKALLGLHPQETLKALAAFVADAPGFAPEDDAQAVVKTVEREVRLAKLDAPATAEQRYALGIVLEPGVVDAQGDTYNADEVRKAAWGYMVSFRNIGLMHKGLVNQKVSLVESYLAPVDMNVSGSVIKAGTWLMGLNVRDDALWDQVKKGGLTGLSIGGFAAKNPA